MSKVRKKRKKPNLKYFQTLIINLQLKMEPFFKIPEQASDVYQNVEQLLIQ